MLDRLQLGDFRNHRATAIAGTARFNLLVGENGAGKTNVLEAISLFAPGRGLRRAAIADMPAQDGAGGFAASAALAAPAGEIRIGTGTEPQRPGRRVVHVNHAEVPAVRLGEWLAISWLTPAMDRLFAESAGARRRFLDRLVLAFEPGHARHAARLETALRERNRLLVDERGADDAWFDAIEAQVADAGAEVARARADLVARLAGHLAKLPEAPFARPALAYLAGGPCGREELAEALAQGRSRDRAAGRTLTGPHRDELAVTMAGRGQPAAECSTGEQKAMLIAIMLGHSSLLATGADAGTRPRVLLLDEVAAHLDPVRRAALFDRLREAGAQVWLTGTELAPFSDIVAEAAIWRVSAGTVERLA